MSNYDQLINQIKNDISLTEQILHQSSDVKTKTKLLKKHKLLQGILNTLMELQVIG
jgi:hypothetical protein